MEKLILISGASRGIGAATALLAAERGYAVAVNYVNDDNAARTVCAAVEARGARAFRLKADVATAAGVSSLFDGIDQIDVPLSAFVNNAGVVGHVMPFTEYSDERLQRTFDVNVIGAFRCVREAIKRMLKHAEGGAIVNVSSAAARIGSPFEFIDYAASKGAMDTLTIGLAKEFGGQGIRVNAVRPGIIRTDIHAAAGAPDRVARIAPQVPLARVGETQEVAQTILWLLSEEASYVTGALLDVAGGR
jgi:NAD(P)-dependent dehydrogenase (short-subunit alcohol dehydrogenase family)